MRDAPWATTSHGPSVLCVRETARLLESLCFLRVTMESEPQTLESRLSDLQRTLRGSGSKSNSSDPSTRIECTWKTTARHSTIERRIARRSSQKQTTSLGSNSIQSRLEPRCGARDPPAQKASSGRPTSRSLDRAELARRARFRRREDRTQVGPNTPNGTEDRAKERISLGMIDWASLPTETWATAKARYKLEHLMLYLLRVAPAPAARVGSGRSSRALWEPDAETMAMLEQDWLDDPAVAIEGRRPRSARASRTALGAATKGPATGRRHEPGR